MAGRKKSTKKHNARGESAGATDKTNGTTDSKWARIDRTEHLALTDFLAFEIKQLCDRRGLPLCGTMDFAAACVVRWMDPQIAESVRTCPVKQTRFPGFGHSEAPEALLPITSYWLRKLEALAATIGVTPVTLLAEGWHALKPWLQVSVKPHTDRLPQTFSALSEQSKVARRYYKELSASAQDVATG